MLIMSVVVFVMYMLLSSFFKQIKSYSDIQNDILSYSLFKNAVKEDVFFSEKVIVGDNFLKFESNRDTVSYFMFDEYVLRGKQENSKKDTFYVKEPVMKLRTLSGKKTTEIVTFTVDYLDFKSKFSFKNKKSNDVYVNEFFDYEN